MAVAETSPPSVTSVKARAMLTSMLQRSLPTKGVKSVSSVGLETQTNQNEALPLKPHGCTSSSSFLSAPAGMVKLCPEIVRVSVAFRRSKNIVLLRGSACGWVGEIVTRALGAQPFSLGGTGRMSKLRSERLTTSFSFALPSRSFMFTTRRGRSPSLYSSSMSMSSTRGS